MKKVFLSIAILISLSAFSQMENAASYKTALGVKISAGVAASYKMFVTPKNALEVQSTFFKQGVRLVGLYEFHLYSFAGAPGLGWYIGPGAHVGFWKKNYRDTYNSTADIGIDGVLGLDYRIKNAPINLSLDWQPSLSLLGNAGLSPQFGGLAIRYILD
ncbi:MAG: hypothetical protein LH478_08290 [Chitinophagaceae bacterium]|nr:hypothetical protein [Chitinophagaceae bacterium]